LPTIKIYCDRCLQQIATADTESLRIPLKGVMFMPAKPGFPYPFPVEQEYIHMRCPFDHNPNKFNRHKPFDDPARLRVTPEGDYFDIGKAFKGPVDELYPGETRQPEKIKLKSKRKKRKVVA